MTECNTVEKTEKTRSEFLVVFLAFSAIIIFLIIGIFFARTLNNHITENFPESDWGKLIGQCVLDQSQDENETSATCQSFSSALQKIVDNSPDENQRVKAVLSLAALYLPETPTTAVQLLEEAYSENLSPENQYYLLSELYSEYETLDESEKSLEILKKLVNLPDDLDLKSEDWANIKLFFKDELAKRENSYEN